MKPIRIHEEIESHQKMILSAVNASTQNPIAGIYSAIHKSVSDAIEIQNKSIQNAVNPLLQAYSSQLFNESRKLAASHQAAMTSMVSRVLQPIANWQSQTLQLIAPQFQSIIDQLKLPSEYIGTLKIDDNESSDELLSDGSEESAIIIPRLQVVNNLPVRVMRAILADPRLLLGIDPYHFEKVVAELLSAQGFQNIQVTKRSGDGGKDILATQFVAGIPVFFCFECKRYTKKRIGVDIMRSLLGAVSMKSSNFNKGVLVTTSSFTSDSKLLIAEEKMIDGKDFNDLVKWIGDYRKAVE